MSFSRVPSEAELLDALRLQITPGLSPRTIRLLLDRFESPTRILEASAAELSQIPDLKPRVLSALQSAKQQPLADVEWKRCQELRVQLLLRGCAGYPTRLAEIPDPPVVLYCRGDFAARDDLAIGIVGSRHCTLYGQQQAERLAGALARAGFTIVSGLARGIDAAAHRGALTAGGRTIAVLANSVADVYPPEHENLAAEIACHGAVVSESPLGRRPLPEMFPQRNRIISGLSLGVIIVEADRKSGSLHTARHALEQNREVFAVPGRIDCRTSDGCRAA
ncbi:MAG: DNA-processing protein DprA [Planctomycetales bacterium]